MFVLQMHGEPGSGKSTLARAIAARTGAFVFDKDIIKAALLRSDIDEAHAGPAAYEVYFAMAHQIIGQGMDLILDNPVYWAQVEERWRALAAAAGSPPLMIECVCADRDELRRRLMSRDMLESQSREPLDLRRFPGTILTASDRLTLDATRPLDDLVEDALRYIAAGVPA